ncbi:DNA/RNA polymerases superfamily protein [Gossypium australe]|uniref:DNA/RNA polymerases superfamily protein n=1 Tax=Gossypium australe TaxID=47621 RepID=A0A5B6WFU2_9ROSI|nr:DNA/RNA polymerases superfamily protein [Gossypium australe]
MKRDISKFVSRCLICQQLVTIPKWKWDRVTMDFISGLPLSLKKKYAIWVVVDRLMKTTHLLKQYVPKI